MSQVVADCNPLTLALTSNLQAAKGLLWCHYTFDDCNTPPPPGAPAPTAIISIEIIVLYVSLIYHRNSPEQIAMGAHSPLVPVAGCLPQRYQRPLHAGI